MEIQHRTNIRNELLVFSIFPGVMVMMITLVPTALHHLVVVLAIGTFAFSVYLVFRWIFRDGAWREWVSKRDRDSDHRYTHGSR